MAQLSSRQAKSPRMAAIDNKLIPETPLDFSFLDIEDLNEVTSLDPRPLVNKKPVKNKDNKYSAKCLRLNNNHLATIAPLGEVIGKLLIEPNALSWLDLSCNELKTIEEVIIGCKNLHILYLHGNKIDKKEEINKLAKLPNLRKLCLHGNPVENVKNYRLYVLSLLPQLQNLDMSAVTKIDKASATNYGKTLVASLLKKEPDEE